MILTMCTFLTCHALFSAKSEIHWVVLKLLILSPGYVLPLLYYPKKCIVKQKYKKKTLKILFLKTVITWNSLWEYKTHFISARLIRSSEHHGKWMAHPAGLLLDHWNMLILLFYLIPLQIKQIIFSWFLIPSTAGHLVKEQLSVSVRLVFPIFSQILPV